MITEPTTLGTYVSRGSLRPFIARPFNRKFFRKVLKFSNKDCNVLNLRPALNTNIGIIYGPVISYMNPGETVDAELRKIQTKEFKPNTDFTVYNGYIVDLKLMFYIELPLAFEVKTDKLFSFELEIPYYDAHKIRK